MEDWLQSIDDQNEMKGRPPGRPVVLIGLKRSDSLLSRHGVLQRRLSSPKRTEYLPIISLSLLDLQ